MEGWSAADESGSFGHQSIAAFRLTIAPQANDTDRARKPHGDSQQRRSDGPLGKSRVLRTFGLEALKSNATRRRKATTQHEWTGISSGECARVERCIQGKTKTVT